LGQDGSRSSLRRYAGWFDLPPGEPTCGSTGDAAGSEVIGSDFGPCNAEIAHAEVRKETPIVGLTATNGLLELIQIEHSGFIFLTNHIN
jgi:hypothetical protein